MKKVVLSSTLAVLLSVLLVAQTTSPVAGQPLVFGADHDGTCAECVGLTSLGFRLYINGTWMGAETPASSVVNGTFEIPLPNGLAAGSYNATVRTVARGVDANGANYTSYSVDSAPFAFTVVPSTAPPGAPLKPFNMRIGSVAEPPPPPPTGTAAAFLRGGSATAGSTTIPTSSYTFSSVKSNTGNLLVITVRTAYTSTVTTTLNGLGNWQLATRIDGTEIWYLVATTTTAGTPVNIAFSAPVANASLSWSEYTLPGTSPITLATTTTFTKTVASTAHPSAPEGGISAQAGDLLISGGTVDNSIGTITTAGAGWTLREELGTRGAIQHMFPSTTITGERGIWNGSNVRLAKSVMVVFRRGTP